MLLSLQLSVLTTDLVEKSLLKEVVRLTALPWTEETFIDHSV